MSSAPFHRRIALATCVVLAAAPLSSALAQQPPRGDQGRAEMMERGERGGRGDERSNPATNPAKRQKAKNVNMGFPLVKEHRRSSLIS
ncbi:hypothetical protein BMR86_18430, partial [Stenotrophomonas sp. KAs 5-3]